MRIIRGASPVEAEKLSTLLCQSITELCVADHHNDPDIIAAWCENKTFENIVAWTEDPNLIFFVMLSDGDRAGLGLAHRRGEILLNYVSPDFRYQGISRALLEALEKALHAKGNQTGYLTSTETAHQFYLDAGWQDKGPKVIKSGVRGWPMQKLLSR